jgi:hypothetical protein
MGIRVGNLVIILLEIELMYRGRYAFNFEPQNSVQKQLSKKKKKNFNLDARGIAPQKQYHLGSTPPAPNHDNPEEGYLGLDLGPQVSGIQV